MLDLLYDAFPSARSAQAALTALLGSSALATPILIYLARRVISTLLRTLLIVTAVAGGIILITSLLDAGRIPWIAHLFA